MPVDASIFANSLKPPKSIIDYQTEYDQADARRNALQLSALDLSERTQATQRAAQIRNALLGLGPTATDEQRIAAMRGTATPEGFTQADALQTSMLNRQKTASQVGLETAQAGKAGAETSQINAKQQADMVGHLGDAVSALQTLPGVTPAHVVATLQNAGKMYNIPDAQIQQAIAQVPQDPAQLPAFLAAKNKELMTAKERMAYITADANTVANNQTSTANNAATNATHVQTTGMTNATSRANNRDTISAENLRAGVTPGGGMDDNSERTAQAIANGQLPAPTGMALLNPKNQRILGRVMEINPQYDATTVSAKKTAAAAFTSGPLGNALRSVSTANAHLDQLGELADALQNGNTQIVNKVQNYFSQQTGSPNVTNFDAIKNIVGQEVVKAIVAGGGGVGEREEAAKIFSSANSPAQLKGAIQHYRMVMGAQANNLLEQRRAAGLPDSTLPNYSNTNPTATGGVPPDVGAILKKYGGK